MPAGSNSKEARVIALLKKQQGLDKFQIANALRYEIAEIQAILRELQGRKTVVSGLEKLEGSSTYDRRYYLI